MLACHRSQSLWVKDIRQKCTWSHLLSSKRREERGGGGGGGRKICMCVDSFSWMQFYLLLIFSGPHKVKPYIWNQTNAHSRRKVRFMLRCMCVVLWSLHMVSGWARAGCINPTLRSGPPSDLRPFALSSNSHKWTARNKWRHVETARTDWINPR